MKSKFIKTTLLNNLMKNGVKSTSEKLMLKATKLIQKNLLQKNFEDIVKLAIVNSSPHIFLKNVKRRKREPFKIPFILNKSKRIFYAAKFIVKQCLVSNFALKLQDKLYLEFIDSAKFESKSLGSKIQ